MKKKISSILIIIGVLIMAYPKISELYNDHKQQRIIQQWEVEEKQEEVQKVESQKKKSSKNDKNNIEGILEIEKINLKLPVLSGATRENLKISLASVDHTGKPGEIGNYAIAGHRSRTYGRNFNRLDELEGGDIIEMNVGKEKYKYTVVDKLYVKPEETWVLNGNDKDREITLIACHPMVNPTHRLIIKGKILN